MDPAVVDSKSDRHSRKGPSRTLGTRRVGRQSILVSMVVIAVLAVNISVALAQVRPNVSERQAPSTKDVPPITSVVVEQSTSSHQFNGQTTTSMIQTNIVATTLGNQPRRSFSERVISTPKTSSEIIGFVWATIGNQTTSYIRADTKGVPCVLNLADVATLNHMCSTKGWSAELMPDTYVQLPAGGNANSLGYSPITALKVLQAMRQGRLVRMGSSTVDGIKTTKFKESIDFFKWYRLSQADFARSIVAGGPSDVPPASVDIWLDSQGRLRQVETMLSFDSNKTTTFLDFNAGVIFG